MSSFLRSRLHRLRGDLVIYGAGGFISKAINFVLLPVYTRIFVPSEFGLIELLYAVMGIFIPFMALGSESSLTYFFFRCKEEGRKAQERVMRGAFQWQILWGGLILCLALGSWPLWQARLLSGRANMEVGGLAMLATFLTLIAAKSRDALRCLHRPWTFVLLNVVTLLVTGAATIFMVLEVRPGVWGFFAGQTLGLFLSALLGWYLTRTFFHFWPLESKIWPSLVRLELPLLPGALAWFVLTGADRWFIAYYLGDAEVGVYAVGARLALALGLVVEAFRQAWWPVSMEAVHQDEGRRLVQTMAPLYLGFTLSAAVLLTLCSPLIVALAAPPEYHRAYPLVGVLAWTSILYGFFSIATSGIWKQQQPGWIAAGMGAASLLNVVLNMMLVPVFGVMGSAVATGLSYLAWNAVTIALSERLWPVGFPFGLLCLQVAIAVAGTAGTLRLLPLHPWASVPVALLAAGLLVKLGLQGRPVSVLFDRARHQE